MALRDEARRSMPRGVPMVWMDEFYDHPPVWVSHGEGSTFTDVDGHTYLDMYMADMSAFCGHAPAPVVEAVARRTRLGNQFLLPGEDAIAVAEHLAGRYGLPKWQFTLSATQANNEVIRLSRGLTGREIVLMFDAHYHGEGDATLVIEEGGEVVPETPGLPPGVAGQARIVQFNDVAALEAALEPGDVALVLAEPAMTNTGFLLPARGYHEQLRRATRDAGTLLALDETHTGCARTPASRGTGARAGLPHARQVDRGRRSARDLRDARRDRLADRTDRREAQGVGGVRRQGRDRGTLFANALSMAAGRAALLDVLSEEAFERTGPLGARMAAGLRTGIEQAGVPWSVAQYGAHASYFFAPEPPTDGAGARAADHPGLRALIRVFMANRGVWESGWWLGPTVSVAHRAGDVDRYVQLFGEFLLYVTRGTRAAAAT
jgi:glutamate-1-semialdehyde aminotransferase